MRYSKAGRYIFIGSRRKSQRGSRKRPVYYDEKTVGVLKRIWVILDAPCGKRLAAYIKYILPVLEKDEEIVLDKDRRKKLLGISAVTYDRQVITGREEEMGDKGEECFYQAGQFTKASDTGKNICPVG